MTDSLKYRLKPSGSLDWNPWLLTAIWLLSILLINPAGDFPLNDDWAYGIIVKKWVEDGTFQLINWGEMTLISHLIHGLTFSAVFGFSFTVLRFSTLIIALTGLIGVYRLGILCGLEKRTSFLASLVVLANPIYMSLSYSYMTDVPFMAICIWSIYFFLKAEKTGSTKVLAWAILFCIWALLCRQLALVIPLSWLIVHVLMRRNLKRSWAWRLAPLVIVVIAFFTFNMIMASNGFLSETYGSKLGVLKGYLTNPSLRLVRNTVGYIFLFTAYIGLFLAPFLVFYKWATLRSKDWWFLFSFTLGVSVLLTLTGKAIPSIDNVFIDLGVGPTTMMDHYGDFRSAPDGGASPMALKVALTILGSFGGGVLCLSVFRWIRDRRNSINFQQSFVFLFIAIYMAPFMITGYYDRYLILIIPPTVVFLSGYLEFWEKVRIRRVSYILLFVFYLFSAFATHDYLSWNRVRWDVIYDLRSQGIVDKNIGGGVEFEGRYIFRNDDPEWWRRPDPEFKVTFTAIPDHHVVSTHRYSRWLPGKNLIYLNQKQNLRNEQ